VGICWSKKNHHQPALAERLGHHSWPHHAVSGAVLTASNYGNQTTSHPTGYQFTLRRHTGAARPVSHVTVKPKGTGVGSTHCVYVCTWGGAICALHPPLHCLAAGEQSHGTTKPLYLEILYRYLLQVRRLRNGPRAGLNKLIALVTVGSFSNAAYTEVSLSTAGFVLKIPRECEEETDFAHSCTIYSRSCICQW
jgi:hypothetical protein